MNLSAQTYELLNLLLRLWRRLSRRRQFQFWLLIGLMLVSAFAEVISLGAVLPFLGILIVPEKVFNHSIIQTLVPPLGITSSDQLILPLTVSFVAAAIIAGILRILLLKVSTRIAFGSGADLGIEVYRRTLYQPYWVHVNRNTSEIISNITYKVEAVVSEVLLPFLMLVSSGVLLTAVMVALLAIDPIVALTSMIGFGASYILITLFVNQRLYINSQRIAKEQTQVVKALQEGLGGIRDILLSGAQSVYCDIFQKADRTLRWAQGDSTFISHSPRYGLEVLGMVLITIIAYMCSLEPGGIAGSMPALGALVLGAQRMLPSLQQVYNSWSRIAGTHSSIIDTLEYLDQSIPKDYLQPEPTPLTFHNSIQCNMVSFRYNPEGPWVLERLNINIPKGARIGFVGRTGSGKSTAMDLLMGLLKPTEGEILVDGEPIIGNRVRAWQKTIAHVPQSIYLADATLAENIAFGVPPEAINMERVQQAAQQAQIGNFIESKPGGYKSLVGERGIRLSGGQRQRIGIARALYKQANVLVFDEATSALDNSTEKELMDSIGRLERELTILLISHRITFVKHCDNIIELDQGKIVKQGNYQQLLEISPSFRKMAIDNETTGMD